LKQNTDKYFKNHLQDITLHLYIQYSGHIALSMVYLVLSSADAYSTDTGLKHSTHRFASTHTPSILCRSSAKSPSLPHPLLSLCYTPHTDSPWHDCPSLAMCWHYMLLIAFLESFPLVQEVSGIPAALMSEASLVLLPSVTIFSFSGDGLWS